MTFVPHTQFDAETGLARRIVLLGPLALEPDFDADWRCSACWSPTGWSGTFSADVVPGGYCGRCGSRFEHAVRGRSPLLIEEAP